MTNPCRMLRCRISAAFRVRNPAFMRQQRILSCARSRGMWKHGSRQPWKSAEGL